MGVFSPSGAASSSVVDSGAVASPSITKLTLTDANTEYTLTIPQTAKRFSIKTRQDAILKVAYISGESGTNYWTVGYGCLYTEEQLNLSGTLSLYIQTVKSAIDVEVIYWD